MSSIPPNVVNSIAQAQLTQQQRAAEADAASEGALRRSEREIRRHLENREFVEDMAAATGLKVDPDARGPSSGGKHGRANTSKRSAKGKKASRAAPNPPDDTPPAKPDSRARSAALLASPDESDKPAPPPFLLDIEA